jgi:hypothetical protein
MQVTIVPIEGHPFHEAMHLALVESVLEEGLDDEERRRRRALRDTLGAQLQLMKENDVNGVLTCTKLMLSLVIMVARPEFVDEVIAHAVADAKVSAADLMQQIDLRDEACQAD